MPEIIYCREELIVVLFVRARFELVSVSGCTEQQFAASVLFVSFLNWYLLAVENKTGA
jgi:hypothetical protein